jgi:hypothetical protein
MPLTASKTDAWTIAPRRMAAGGGTAAVAKVAIMIPFHVITVLGSAACALAGAADVSPKATTNASTSSTDLRFMAQKLRAATITD